MRKDILDIIKKSNTLTPEWQAALLWLYAHMEIVDWLTIGDKIPPKKLEQIKKQAIVKNDYVLASICIYKQLLDEES